MKQPPAVLEFLSNQEKVVSLISDLTNQPKNIVLSRLREEYLNPGIVFQSLFQHFYHCRYS